MKATPEALEALHGLLAGHLADQIAAAKKSGDPLPASLVKEIREFLKDNGVEQNALPTNPIGKLAGDVESLPFPGEMSH
jgi:hypothetical protein